MPNASNILSPINIHGIGRSGTTLLQNIFGATGFIQICNETQGLLYCGYRGGEILNSSNDKESPKSRRHPLDAVKVVHSSYAATMPSNKPAWCQKVGGIPNYVYFEPMITESDLDVGQRPYRYAYQWYWDVLHNSFPFSFDILILRDFRDVVVSRSKYSGFRVDDICTDIEIYARIIRHQAAKYDHVVFYDELAAYPKVVVPKLFEAADIAYQDSYLKAMKWHAAPSHERSLETAGGANYGWNSDYDTVLGTERANRLETLYLELKAQFTQA